MSLQRHRSQSIVYVPLELMLEVTSDLSNAGERVLRVSTSGLYYILTRRSSHQQGTALDTTGASFIVLDLNDNDLLPKAAILILSAKLYFLSS